VKKLGAGFFGGEASFWRSSPAGQVFVHGGGDFIEFTLKRARSCKSTPAALSLDESVDYDIQIAGGIKTAIFGGEGLFLATLTGPGGWWCKV